MSVPLSQAPNFRDLGGLPAGDGRCIRRGVLFRSEGLNNLSPEDIGHLDALGLQLVCDLRSASERDRYPSRLPERPRPTVMVAHVESEHEDPEATTVDLAAVDALDAIETYMSRFYASLPRAMASTIGELITRIAGGGTPVLVHCAAGKDRTGFVCAMLLHAVGASEQTILSDYLATDRFYGAERVQEVLRGLGRDVAPGSADAFRVSARWPAKALAAMREDHVSIEDYLERGCGLTPDQRVRLVDLLTEPIGRL